MQNHFNITENNFMLYAIHMYDNPCVNTFEEFVSDLRYVKLIKRIFSKYVRSGRVNIRLLLNHFIILHNVFDTSALCKILFFKIDSEYYPQLKTCLLFLDYLPETVHGINGIDIQTVRIPLDPNLIKKLRCINKGD